MAPISLKRKKLHSTTICKGQVLLIMEAMKMEHSIRAPADGTLVEFYYQAGDLVSGGAELVKFELGD